MAGAFLETIKRMEPNIFTVGPSLSYTSVAISLKRIADALDTMSNPVTRTMAAVMDRVESNEGPIVAPGFTRRYYKGKYYAAGHNTWMVYLPTGWVDYTTLDAEAFKEAQEAYQYCAYGIEPGNKDAPENMTGGQGFTVSDTVKPVVTPEAVLANLIEAEVSYCLARGMGASIIGNRVVHALDRNAVLVCFKPDREETPREAG